VSLKSAILTRDVAELPSRRDEDWRWTDLRGLIRSLPEPSPEADRAAIPAGPFAALSPDDEIVVANGRLPASGTYLVPADERRTLALRFVSAASEAAHAAKLTIMVADGAQLTLLESYEGLGQGYVSAVELDILVMQGASVERIVLAADEAEAVSVSEAQVKLNPTGRFAQTVVTDGGRRQRLQTKVTHAGGQAALRLDGAYLLAGKRHADLTTCVEHTAVHGTTDQLTKGVVADQARGVFQGRIIVAQGADHTEARMGHHALVLSDQAEVDAKPELEIYADDVACAHGNTVGALDEEALFYIRQRGVPEPEARAMLTEAFVGEVIDRIEHEGAREAVRAWAAERLEG
jgi:Fe-S cluster assembly protein SufD